MDEHPEQRINLHSLVAYIATKACGNDPTKYANTHTEVQQYLNDLHAAGEIEWKTGKGGGVLLKWLTTTSSLPNNYTCKHCKNEKLNTSNDKVCWSCGTPVEGYTKA